VLPDSLNLPLSPFLAGAIILAVGCAIAAIGFVIKSRNAERELDERYVRLKRGEEVAATEPPRIARILERVGAAVAGLGIVVLVLAWTLTPGQH
jgi:hypothetical protein